MHLLYLPNEIEGDQVGPRAALATLQQKGIIQKLDVFPYKNINKKVGNWQKTIGLLIEMIKKNKPTSILVQHLTNYEFPPQFFSELKQIYDSSPLPVLAYDERDVYGLIQKPLPRAVRKFTQECDIVFLVAGGEFAERFRRFGCKNVCYLPNVMSSQRSSPKWNEFTPKKFDVVMIGNNFKSRNPFRTIPGAKGRKLLASELAATYGDKFALFGSGWQPNPCDKGPVDFFRQEEILSQAWISVGYGHFPNYQGFFSNSLPIILASGVPYLLKRTSGIENFLVDGYHCRFFDTVNEAITISREMLSMNKQDLIRLGKKGSELAEEMLNEELRMENLIGKLQLLETVKNKNATIPNSIT